MTNPSPPTLLSCVEEALTTPDPIRGAWLAVTAAKLAAKLEAAAGAALHRPPAPTAPVLAAAVAAQTTRLATVNEALTAGLAKVYKSPDQAAQTIVARLNERGLEMTLKLLAVVPDSFGTMHGGAVWGRHNREQRHLAGLAAKALPALFQEAVTTQAALNEATAALASRRALLADPTHRQQEEALSTLREVETATVAHLLPGQPPASIPSLIAPSPTVPKTIDNHPPHDFHHGMTSSMTLSEQF